jgi:hypothetical protein
MNKEENPSPNVSSEQHLPSQELPGLEPRNHITVGRRSFIRDLGIVGATLLSVSAILMREAKAQEQSSGRLTKGDADLLRFAAWAEIVESDIADRFLLPQKLYGREREVCRGDKNVGLRIKAASGRAAFP